MPPFDWIRPGYEVVKISMEWNVQMPFLQTTDGSGKCLASSPYFSSQEIPNSQWKLHLFDKGTKLSIRTMHYDSDGDRKDLVDPILVKSSIVSGKGLKLFQQMIPSKPYTYYVRFCLTKKDVLQSECQQEDGSYTFNCKIWSHVKKEFPPYSLPVATSCSNELSTQLEGLFESMQFSDVNFKIRGCDFLAHKNILATRSQVFAAVFQHPTQENLTNQITIEDIEPEVFHQLLRYIYTGRLISTTLETMAVGLFIAADKYMLDGLKSECENYLLQHMSPVNCLELLIGGDLLNPGEHLEEAAKYFLRFPNKVTAIEKWKKLKQENSRLLCDIQEFLLCFKKNAMLKFKKQVTKCNKRLNSRR